MDLLFQNWDKIINKVKEEYEIPDVSYDAFLKPLEPYAIDSNTLIILFQDENDRMGLNYINNKYGKAIRVAIAEVTGFNYDLKFILPKDAKNLKLISSSSDGITTNENYKYSNLNSKFTFEKFVVGDNNRFAQNASLAVSESPGTAFNPLYIYGGPGLGKTHLMHSIGNFIMEHSPETKVLYVTSEDFVNEVIDSIRSTNNADSMSKFREKYRSVDVLMIDDIQFIIGKDKSESEFFHTFNSLYSSEKQIVLSSDCPPKEMDNLEERIKSRFEMGLLANIGNPDYETRMAILRKKLEVENINIGDDVLNYIAENITSNIRELEGALNKLIAYHNLENTNITLDIAKTEISNLINPSKKKEITPQYIIEIVALYYNITIEQMCSSNRSRSIARPRQISMYLCKELTTYPLQSIGNLLGGKDHSTVIHGINKISDEYSDNTDFQKEIDDIKNKIFQLK